MLNIFDAVDRDVAIAVIRAADMSYEHNSLNSFAIKLQDIL